MKKQAGPLFKQDGLPYNRTVSDEKKEACIMDVVNNAVFFLQKNSELILLGVVALIFLAMLQLVHQTRKIRKKMGDMEQSLRSCFTEMAEENADREAELAGEMKRQKEAVKEVLLQKERKQEEAVFDAVLQEIFP